MACFALWINRSVSSNVYFYIYCTIILVLGVIWRQYSYRVLILHCLWKNGLENALNCIIGFDQDFSPLKIYPFIKKKSWMKSRKYLHYELVVISYLPSKYLWDMITSPIFHKCELGILHFLSKMWVIPSPFLDVEV